jgi:hypothetical protein
MTPRVLCIALCVALVAVVVGCTEPTGSPRPSPSLIELDFTPPPTTAPPVSPGGSPGQTLVSWPIGWDVAFCRAMTEVVIAQELVVDIERAIDDDARREALGLARELVLVAGGATQLLADVPDWAASDDAVASLTGLMDLGGRAAAEYERYLDDGPRRALRRARNLRRENADAVPVVNEQLQPLADAGLACPGTPLEVESP